MTAARDCPQHGAWADDGTTEGCPECLAWWLHLYGASSTPDWPWLEAMARQAAASGMRVRADLATDPELDALYDPLRRRTP